MKKTSTEPPLAQSKGGNQHLAEAISIERSTPTQRQRPHSLQ